MCQDAVSRTLLAYHPNIDRRGHPFSPYIRVAPPRWSHPLPASIGSPALSINFYISAAFFLTQAVLDSHIQALRGILAALFGDRTGDIEIDLILDEEDESRSHLINHCCIDIRFAARSR